MEYNYIEKETPQWILTKASMKKISAQILWKYYWNIINTVK